MFSKYAKYYFEFKVKEKLLKTPVEREEESQNEKDYLQFLLDKFDEIDLVNIDSEHTEEYLNPISISNLLVNH